MLPPPPGALYHVNIAGDRHYGKLDTGKLTLAIAMRVVIDNKRLVTVNNKILRSLFIFTFMF
tara:strand:+ start:542 stop:727 length:186 start_codon:yes stop_codon:yes gene_type:complete